MPDPRFCDPAWQSNTCLRLLRRTYLRGSGLVRGVTESLPFAPTDQLALRVLTRATTDAVAPPNFLFTNPTAARRAWSTRGRSLAHGARNFLTDVRDNRGMPALVDKGAFVVGRDLATTPGRVVFRNHLVELIQYEPRTETVHALPLLFNLSWVNKFYLADLTPDRSLIRWALDQGHTVFVISYRNPDATLRNVGYDDYLCAGLLPVLEVIRDITGAEEVNFCGSCLGGLLGLMLAAWHRDDDRPRLRSVTALNTPADFGDITRLITTGAVGRLLRGPGVRLLDRLTERQGFTGGKDFEAFFRLLRSNELLWNQVKDNWLMGKEPPAYDVLYWNCDTLNVPHRAQRYLLRDLCIDNAFARGTAELAGRPLPLDRITQDVFLVGTSDDHLVPWRISHKTVALLPGDVRYYLSVGGHIAGLIAPPDTGARYRTTTGRACPDADTWSAEATEYEDSWWRPWSRWLAERAGPQRVPPSTGSARYPPMDPAPGTYVLT
ncbi:PHA/PHB synthase family protein [Spirillospora sp. NPDC048911]|uniref:PHA/PHB synthase family protein n=1 Tax=Spirillospora sp. NPDC048911 TaxID=3364527 RepID=UPI003723A48D